MEKGILHRKLSNGFVLATMYVLAFGVFLIDAMLHHDLDMFFFYLPMIISVALITNMFGTICMVGFTSVLWVAKYMMSYGAGNNLFLLWNAFVAVGTFTFVGLIMHYIRKQHRMINVRNVTLKEQLHQEQKDARCDSLTAILNRRGFEEVFSREFARVKRYRLPTSLLYFDLDNFKQINDTYGHAFGDEILRQFVAEVNGFIRTTDIFARWGGDEFILLLPHTDNARARAVAQRISARLEHNKILSVSVSIGLRTLVGEEVSPAEVIADVDRAMYAVKNRKKRDLATMT